jgi:DNA-binding transcriptional LysR family regulator
LRDLSGLRLFVLAAQHKSFAAAARQAQLSNASMSRQISALERNLSVRLFNRGTRALTLTEAGRILLARLLPMLSEMDEIFDSVSLLEAEPRGLLRVAIRGLIASQRVIPALPAFLDAHPHLEIDLQISTDENKDLVTENIDVDIRFDLPDSGDLVAKRLGPITQLVLLASPAYLAKRAAPISVKDLSEHSAILYGAQVEQPVWEFAGPDGATTRVMPVGQLSVDDGGMNRSALLAGVGIGIMPLEEIKRELAGGRLIRLLSDHRIIRPRTGNEGIYAVYQRSAYQTGKLRSFLEFLDCTFRASSGSETIPGTPAI